eukprot:4787466-Alexandrium_andersonii.AAC.1
MPPSVLLANVRGLATGLRIKRYARACPPVLEASRDLRRCALRAAMSALTASTSLPMLLTAHPHATTVRAQAGSPCRMTARLVGSSPSPTAPT